MELPADRMMNSMTKTPAEQLVVLGQVLASELMLGYEDIVNTEVLRFNGELVANLAHLAEMVDSCTERYLTFDLQHSTTVVLDTRKAKAATPQILEAHGIPSERSQDLQERRSSSGSKGKAKKADGGGARGGRHRR